MPGVVSFRFTLNREKYTPPEVTQDRYSYRGHKNKCGLRWFTLGVGIDKSNAASGGNNEENFQGPSFSNRVGFTHVVYRRKNK
jgi:hypothetical protein